MELDQIQDMKHWSILYSLVGKLQENITQTQEILMRVLKNKAQVQEDKALVT